ncbi:MAG: zeta toxin family protein [Candidatus Pacearchaeota archaeon]|nr:zeta toxin family protein [Candidatus Pacearchaeota archaeon]
MNKEEKTESPFLILVAGGAGSGKTTVAEMIAKASGKRNVLLLSIDNYYRDRSDMSIKERKK